MLDTTTTLADVLYPPIEPHSEGMLQVSDLHTIAWEQSGNPSGIPVVVIHGGPGVAGNHRTVSTSTRVRSTSSSSTSAVAANQPLTLNWKTTTRRRRLPIWKRFASIWGSIGGTCLEDLGGRPWR